MNQQNIANKYSLLSGDLFNLPIGIIECERSRDVKASQQVLITYCNPFASSLLAIDSTQSSYVFLDSNPYLQFLYQFVLTVLQTGKPIITEVFLKNRNCWVECSIYRNDETCLIYLKTVTSPETSRPPGGVHLATVLKDISDHIFHTQTNNLDAYIKECLSKIGNSSQIDRVTIFTYSHLEEKAICTHAWCAIGIDPLPASNQKIPIQQFTWWNQLLVNQEPLSLNSFTTSSINPDSQSVLIVPMVYNNRLTGFIGLDAVGSPRVWDKNEIDLLKAFSSLILTAMNRVKREQHLQRTNKRLMGLNRLNQALINNNVSGKQPDLAALEYLFEMIPCELGIALRIDQTGQLASAESRIRHGKREEWPGIRLPAMDFHYGQFSQNKELLINSLKADSPGFSSGFNPYTSGHRSFLGIPLFAHQQYIGLLILLDKSPGFFTQEHVLIGKEVASHLSTLVYQHEVHQELIVKADELDQSNQLLQAVINTSPTGLALLKPAYAGYEIIDFHYLINNPKSAVITELSQEAMIGQSLLTLFPHLFANGVFDKMVNVIQTGESQQFQLLDELPTGAFWGDFSLVRVGADLLFSVNDITHTKQIEEELRQTNAKLERNVAERSTQIQQLTALQRAILQYAGLAIAATDTRGIIQLVNPALEELTGYFADELVGKVTPGALREPNAHQQQIEQLIPDLNNAALSGEDVITAYLTKHDFLRRENTLLTKAGKSIPVLSTVSGLYDDQKNLLGFVDIAIDISNLKTIEQKLIQANQRNQVATKAGKLGVWEWNLDTNQLELDEQFYSFFNLPDHIRIHSLNELKKLVHADDVHYFNQHEQEIIDGRKPFNLEFRVRLPTTKAIHWVRVDGIILRDEKGIRNRMVGVIRDRTAKRKAEYALQESETKYRSLVDHLKEAVFQTDANGLWTYLNPAWEDITGYGVGESLGKLFLTYVHADDQAQNQALFAPMIARQKTYCRHVVRYIHKNGGYRWIEVFAQLTLDEQDQITGTTGTLTDITDRKKAEETLQDSEQRFREIAELVDEFFWIRDTQGHGFAYMNPTYEKFTGKSVQHLYDNPLSFLTFVLEEDRSRIAAAFNSSEPGAAFDFRVWHKDGSIRWLSARLFWVYDDAGEIIRRIGVASDITTIIESKQILQEALENERALNELKSQFVATASHEFRTPLTAISTSIELLRYYANVETGNPITPVLNKHADNISQKVLALNELIMDTLTISKLNEGKQEVNLELTDVTELVKTLVALDFDDRPDKRQVDVQTNGPAVAVLVDKKLMTHVLTNLLTNAFKFSTGNPLLTIRYVRETCRISVTDDGIGIPKKDIPNLFSKFFRASNANATKGTGLGLAICREYVTLQNGVIEIDSVEDVGTTFSVTLPVG